MRTYIDKYYLSLLVLIALSSCTAKRVVKSVAGAPIYLEKKDKYCNLFYKNTQSKFILVADSVKTMIGYDSVFAYSRVIFSTIPDMVIVKIEKDGNLTSRYVEGKDFKTVFLTYFPFPASTKTSVSSEVYDFLGGEEIIDEKNIIKHL